jgi:predicted RNA-binding Zn-ribbon protein involved in translation (DUF1610 family)
MLGHTRCGAVSATIKGSTEGYIRYITEDIREAIGSEKDDYKAKAEEQLLQLKELEENKNCQLIRLKNVIFWTCYAANFVLLFISCYIENDRPLKIFLAVFSCVFITLMSFIRLITERMGKIPYECEKCGHQHIPSTLNLVFNPTILSPTANTYYMKCPHCGERTLHIRILSKD